MFNVMTSRRVVDCSECPDGFYAAQLCNNYSDRVCKRE